jgi:hypothetical protein
MAAHAPFYEKADPPPACVPPLSLYPVVIMLQPSSLSLPLTMVLPQQAIAPPLANVPVMDSMTASVLSPSTPLETATRQAALHRRSVSAEPLLPSHSSTEKHGFNATVLLPWASFIGLGALGIVQPEVVLPATALVATNFPARFVGQDTIGMALPRTGVSLERGADEYDPIKDPEAQKRHGLSRTVYVDRQKLAHANWANLKEEMWREMASAPMVLIISTIGFTTLKPLSRVMGGQPLVARRAIELPYQDINTFCQALKASPPPPPFTPHAPEATKTWAKSFFANLFMDETDHKGQSLLDKSFTVKQNLRQTISDIEYDLPDSYIQHLKEANVDGRLATELAEFTPQSRLPFSAKTADPVIVRTTTLRQVIDQWAEAMADHVVLDATGVKGNLLSQEARSQNHQAQARLNYYTRLLDQGVQAINQERPATHGNKITQWAIQLGGAHGPENKVIGGRTGLLRHMDKFRDFVVAIAKQAPLKETTAEAATSTAEVASEAFASVVNGVRDRLVTEKLGLVTVFTAANCAFAWWLSHAIQKGRPYPANDKVRLDQQSAVSNVATASSPGGLALRSATSTVTEPAANSQTDWVSPSIRSVSGSLVSPMPADSPFMVRELPPMMAPATVRSSTASPAGSLGPGKVFSPLPQPVVGPAPSGFRVNREGAFL